MSLTLHEYLTKCVLFILYDFYVYFMYSFSLSLFLSFSLAIIITAAMNDVTTLRVLSLFESLMHTKVLLIDIVATSFNAENRFYKYLTRINPESQLMSNLLLLTILSDNYRYFLNVAFDNNGIEMVQNFRQQKIGREMGRNGDHNSNKEKQQQQQQNWPIHLDKSVTDVLQKSDNRSSSSTFNATTNEFELLQKRIEECLNFKDISKDINAICLNSIRIKENCLLAFEYEMLDRVCQNHANLKEQQLIDSLRNFIDYFNFYDFLIANILNSTPSTKSSSSSKSSKSSASTKHVPKYDFIVLDVVRGIGNNNNNKNGTSVDATSHISVANDTSNNNMFEFINGKHHHHLQQQQQHPYNSNSYENSSSFSHSSTPSSSTHSLVFKWRPLFILEQPEINLKTYITHSILPGYDDWLLVSTAQLWHCGSICWTIIAICVGVLLVIVVASVAAGIAMRYIHL